MIGVVIGSGVLLTRHSRFVLISETQVIDSHSGAAQAALDRESFRAEGIASVGGRPRPPIGQ